MVRKKTNVVVLMGGRTPEYEVSIASGVNVIKNLSKRKYEIIPIVISRDGKTWYLSTPHTVLSLPNPLESSDPTELIPPVRTNLYGINQVKAPVDVVFIAMHGTYGEDGTIQGALELAGVPYTGSGVTASALSMNKLIFRQLMKHYKIKIPKYVALRKGDRVSQITKVLGKPPYFVKPNNQGSSVGCTLVKEKSELKKALSLAWKYSDTSLIDEYIKGKELTIGVVGTKRPKALPIVEIITPKDYFDYQAKYKDSETQEIVPADLTKRTAKKLQNLGVRIHTILGCRGVTRVDMILKPNNTPIVLEINTIPGMTENSLIPKAARAAGISLPQLIDTIIKDAIKNS